MIVIWIKYKAIISYFENNYYKDRQQTDTYLFFLISLLWNYKITKVSQVKIHKRDLT